MSEPGATSGLANSRWQVYEARSGTTVVAVRAQLGCTLTFSQDSVVFFDGVNTGQGRFTEKGDRVRVQDCVSTLAAWSGSDEAMRLLQDVFGKLGTGRWLTWQVDGDTLTLAARERRLVARRLWI